MSDFHLLTVAPDLSTCRFLAHIPTPAGSNNGGIPWRKIMKRQGGASKIPEGARKFPDEVRDIRAGRLIEVDETITFTPNDPVDDVVPPLTNPQRIAQIKARVTQLNADISDTDSDLYKQHFAPYVFYGWDGDL